MGQDISKYDGKEKTIVKWLNDNKLKDTTIVPMKKLPEYSEVDEKALRDLSIDLENIVERNQKINDNNTYKRLFYQLDLGLLQSKIKEPESYHDLIARQGLLKGYIEEWQDKEKEYKYEDQRRYISYQFNIRPA